VRRHILWNKKLRLSNPFHNHSNQRMYRRNIGDDPGNFSFQHPAPEDYWQRQRGKKAVLFYWIHHGNSVLVIDNLYLMLHHNISLKKQESPKALPLFTNKG